MSRFDLGILSDDIDYVGLPVGGVFRILDLDGSCPLSKWDSLDNDYDR